MGLDLYSKVEPYLGFEEEVINLHKAFLNHVFTNDLDNIIDIGCGQGYFLENLAINGKKALGVDLSVEQVKVCLAKGLNAKAIELNKIEEKFDCATAIFDVINYIPSEHLQNFFHETALVLNQGGSFIFDVNSYFGFEEVAQGSINIDSDDKFIAIDAFFEDDELKTEITLFTEQTDGSFSKEQDAIIQYFHEDSFIHELLNKAGFEVTSIQEFKLHCEDEADKLIFICKKL